MLGRDVRLTAVGGLAQVRDWVARGDGIALLPEFAVRADLDAGRVAAVNVDTPPLRLRPTWRDGPDIERRLRPLLFALSQA